MASCCLLRGYQRLGGTYCFLLDSGNPEDALCYSEMIVPAYHTVRSRDVLAGYRVDLWKELSCAIPIINLFRTN